MGRKAEKRQGMVAVVESFIIEGLAFLSENKADASKFVITILKQPVLIN